MNRTALSQFSIASLWFCAADNVNHISARTKSRGTPSPLAYIAPRLSIRAPFVSRELKPPRRFCVIVLLVVQMAQLVLGVRASLVHSAAEPLHTFAMVCTPPRSRIYTIQ